MINTIVVVGRLTKDPVIRYTPKSGAAVCTFTLAVNRDFTNKDGEREADFINIVAWKKTGENAANFLKKGSLVGIHGRLQTRNYEGDNGRRVYVAEVIAERIQYFDKREVQGGQAAGTFPSDNDAPREQAYTNNYADVGVPIEISEADLPF
ncbi:single-stranded DNA-binding protein [Listeria booriae]|uniref:Single-stranded DNA-binding protein n=1 Tax=Listeria booriae TaxID=1552123 RepID=A0A7X0XN36_9LIST|nr:single-stranded DNA-binding protein [Listeria booriae]MBC1563647.1 single-stranded DNA-binding protein [Listeria booriae]